MNKKQNSVNTIDIINVAWISLLTITMITTATLYGNGGKFPSIEFVLS